MMQLDVTGFESGKTVQVRIYNVTTATEVVAWTATGVNERATGEGYSTYYYDYAIVAGDKYIVDWKDNSTPVNTASEGINEKQSGVALEGNIETHVTASLNSYDPPTRAEATADKDAIITQVDANETKIDTISSNLTRVLGLVLDNAVEDDIVRDGNGNKTSSILYHYNSAANATTHDKVTGLIGKYNVVATYSGNNMTLFKTPRVT